jgi:hypothetical protein
MKLIIAIVIIAAGYWYWSGPYQSAETQSLADHLKENKHTMQRCMKKEGTMGGLGGMAGMSSDSDGAQDLCANKNDLYLKDGQWYSKGTAEY